MTFVALEMCELVAQHALMRPAHGGHGKGIGGGTAEHEEDVAVCFEEIAHECRGPLRPRVISVRAGMTGVGLRQRVPDFRTNPRVVVAGELPETSGTPTRWKQRHAPILRVAHTQSA